MRHSLRLSSKCKDHFFNSSLNHTSRTFVSLMLSHVNTNYHRNSDTHLPSSTDVPEEYGRRRWDRLRVLRSLLETKYKERDSITVESVVVKKLLGSSASFTGDKHAQKPAKYAPSILRFSKVFFFTIPHDDILTLWNGQWRGS